jgi:heme exporter protein D
MLSIIIIYFLINFVISLANNQTKSINQLNINIDYRENDTIILFYNLTTNYSYFITFRSFGNEQLKFGLFLSSNKYEEHSMEIIHQYYTTEFSYLFIICFHFILPNNNLDIQCKDIRLLKANQIKFNSSEDFLPSYNPLFVPMMYALSILMLLPVIIQHHRQKQAILLQRQKELRRLSVTIAQDTQNPKQNFAQKILSQIIENGSIHYKNLPKDIELLSVPSTNTILDDTDDNSNVPFTLQNLRPIIHKYDDNDINEQPGIDAHDCIAHLLDNTPWNMQSSDQPFSISSSRHLSVVRDSARARKEQHVPTIISFPDDDDDQKPILKSKYSRTNRSFVESDV